MSFAEDGDISYDFSPNAKYNKHACRGYIVGFLRRALLCHGVLYFLEDDFL